MFNPMMPGFGRLAVADVETGPWVLLRRLKEGLHGLVKRALIAFERQDIVSPLRSDLSRNVPLGPHRIQGANRALEIQHLEEFRNRGNLIPLRIPATVEPE